MKYLAQRQSSSIIERLNFIKPTNPDANQTIDIIFGPRRVQPESTERSPANNASDKKKLNQSPDTKMDRCNSLTSLEAPVFDRMVVANQN